MTLRVTLEIVPHGVESKKYRISTINIHNSGKKDFRNRAMYYGDIDGETFENVYHDRSDGALVLVQAVLNQNTLTRKNTV